MSFYEAFIQVSAETGCDEQWKIYNACCQTNCDFVAKIQPASYKWEQEYGIQQALARNGLTIPILDVWLFEDSYEKVVFIMLALRETLAVRIASIFVSDQLSLETKIIEVAELMFRATLILLSAFKLGYFNTDAHAENFMFDDIDNLYIIDLGSVKYIEPNTKPTTEDLDNLLSPLANVFTIYFYMNPKIRSYLEDTDTYTEIKSFATQVFNQLATKLEPDIGQTFLRLKSRIF